MLRYISVACLLCCTARHFATANWQLTQLDTVLSAMKDRERECLDGMVPSRAMEMSEAAGSHCPAAFDGFICWPRTPADSQLSRACPTGVFLGGHASRSCRSDGSWHFPEHSSLPQPGADTLRVIVLDSSYTNYSDCQTGSLYEAVARRMRATQVSETSQQLGVGLERLICQTLASRPRSSVGDCAPTFDSALCWRAAPAGSRVFMSCPGYVNDVDRRKLAWRICLPNGSWLWPESVPAKPAHAEGWTNFSDCSVQKLEDDGQIPLSIINAIHMMGHVGYGISLAFLLLAILILAVFRRLHCQRNGIHVNMFFAFLLRAVSHFVTYFALSNEQTAACRVNQSLMTYSVLASFAWVFVEALHLYMLIFVNTMSTSKLSTISYMAIGWGTPCVFTGIWVILRIVLDNNECWRTYQPMGADIWLVNIYLCLLVFINAGLFIRIVRELFVKLKSQPRTSAVSQNYRKLWKSTSVLVLVFGIYYIIFLPMSIIPKDKLGATLDYIKLFYEHFVNSFQGVFVSLLFCFVNSEVHRELKRLLLDTKPGKWLKDRGLIKPLEDAYGLEPESRRNNRRARRRDTTECIPLETQQAEQIC